MSENRNAQYRYQVLDSRSRSHDKGWKDPAILCCNHHYCHNLSKLRPNFAALIKLMSYGK